MKRLTFIVLFIFYVINTNAQIYQDSAYVNTSTGWNGVDIRPASPASIIFRNNSITSVNTDGYMLRAGDDIPAEGHVNYLDGAVISGNKLDWNGVPGSDNTHGIMLGYSINYHVKYNYIDRPYLGLVYEGTEGMTYTAGGAYYNILKKGRGDAIVLNGQNGVNVYGNTFFSSQPRWSPALIKLDLLTQVSPTATSNNIKIKNNIFYTKNHHAVISFADTVLTTLECDYNVYWAEDNDNTPAFYNATTSTYLTWEQWRALGFDEHSVVINPNFIDTVNFVPSEKLSYGTDLGTSYDYGLTTTADWIVGEYPDTIQQGTAWQVGARLYSSDGDLGGYYVSLDGDDDNPGTFDLPWKNWSKAFHTAQAGDTVYFRGGTYSTDVTDGLGIQYYPSHGFGNDGTADNPICYFNYPGEIPILDCTGTYPTSEENSYARALYIYGVDYAHIKGLQIKGVYQRSTPGSTGSYDVVKALDVNYCDHVKLENMVVSNVGGKAIQLGNNYYIEVINCDAYDCCDYYHKSMPGNYGGGISVNNLEFDNGYNYIYGCRAWRCSDQGLCAGGSESLAIFENCWSFDNGKIDGNITGEGHGIKIGMMYSTSTAPIQCIVTNCVFSKNGRTDGIGDGITTNDDIDTYAMSIHVYNNFVYQSGRFGFVAYNTASPDEDELKRILKNNVSYESYNTNMYLAPNALYTHSNNSWDHTVTVTDEDFLSLDHSQLYRPRKADSSLPDITFGRLAAGSDLIDAGANVGLPFNGSAPDLGAYEYVAQDPAIRTSIIKHDNKVIKHNGKVMVID